MTVIPFPPPPSTEPDPEWVRQDAYGRTLYCFSVHYKLDRHTMNVRVWAYDWEDAEAHVAALRATAEVSGQIYTEGPL